MHEEGDAAFVSSCFWGACMMRVDGIELIDIALAADGGYFCGLFVTACSIANYADESAKLRFNILDGGIAERDWNFLLEKARAIHQKSEFNRIFVNDELFKDYPAWHGNKMAYARLMLQEALPDVDWCIYCDVDFLWMRDIVELWKERDDKYVFIGTKDGVDWTLKRERVWFEKNGHPFDPEKYFCSGLCFFNLRAFREQGLIHKIETILKAHPDIQYPDQAALNIATFGQTKIVSKCWQQFHQDVTPDMIAEGVVIHYAGAIPWKAPKGAVALLRDLDLLWHRLNAEARGISVWRSLRIYMSTGSIIYHRGLRNLLYGLNRIHCLGWLRWMLAKTGHKGVWEFWERGFQRLAVGS